MTEAKTDQSKAGAIAAIVGLIHPDARGILEAAAKVGMVHPGHQPKGPLAWLRGHFLRLV